MYSSIVKLGQIPALPDFVGRKGPLERENPLLQYFRKPLSGIGYLLGHPLGWAIKTGPKG
jgi:hypothetical protein